MCTTIVATIGPSSHSLEMIQGLVGAGVGILRNNFSHCLHSEYEKRLRFVEGVRRELGSKVFMMADLQGPRIRVGEMPAGGRELKEGEEVRFSTELGEDDAIFIDYPKLHEEVRAGEALFLTNGLMELEVARVEGRTIFARVVRGGVLFSHKGVNLPHTKLSGAGLTEKDEKDLKFVLEKGVDMVAVSFVQSARDMERAQEFAGDGVKLIAKIETALAVTHIEEIIASSDGIMVARGDLGIEVPMEQVPFLQKEMVAKAKKAGIFSIVATQMLMSMTKHPHPTRAEVSDVANAVWDGADMVMLSDETASGEYPVEAAQAMARIVKEAERRQVSLVGV